MLVLLGVEKMGEYPFFNSDKPKAASILARAQSRKL
jgi:hypothetical protein